VTLGVTASRLNSPENEATNFEAAMARLAPIATVIAFGFVSMVRKKPPSAWNPPSRHNPKVRCARLPKEPSRFSKGWGSLERLSARRERCFSRR